MLLLTMMISGSDQDQVSVNSTSRQMCPYRYVEYYFPTKVVHEDFCIPAVNIANNELQHITHIPVIQATHYFDFYCFRCVTHHVDVDICINCSFSWYLCNKKSWLWHEVVMWEWFRHNVATILRVRSCNVDATHVLKKLLICLNVSTHSMDG